MNLDRVENNEPETAFLYKHHADFDRGGVDCNRDLVVYEPSLRPLTELFVRSPAAVK
jgi:hypothetical protein